jgi:hypothetical protein
METSDISRRFPAFDILAGVILYPQPTRKNVSSETTNNGDAKVAEGISKAAAEKTPDRVVQYKHKYKWRGEEITILVVLYGITIGLAVWGFMNEMNVGMFIASGIALVIAGAVTQLGAGRKHKSRLLATHNKTTGDLTVEGNGYKPNDNTINLAKATRLYLKKKVTRGDGIDPKDILVIGKDTGKGVEIPMRLVSRAGFLEFITELSKELNPKGDKKVDEFLEAARVYKG